MRNNIQVLQDLRTRGNRITVARKNIVDILSESGEPLCASDILGALAKRGAKADKVTVYRELTFLEKEGVVVPIQLQDRNRRYELAEMEHHHHLICQKCRRVQDVFLETDLEDEEEKISKKMKFKILRHSLEFFGLCRNCL